MAKTHDIARDLGQRLEGFGDDSQSAALEAIDDWCHRLLAASCLWIDEKKRASGDDFGPWMQAGDQVEPYI
ncbi:hypothetical protein PPNSA23_37350 [Phyllobacterium phragmitis]|uniref:Uncharacterized protein n=1 Tax=Phyllobacterium phragmitis TaxID=2670329 RepID=A0ABQ0H4F9_9HYPH